MGTNPTPEQMYHANIKTLNEEAAAAAEAGKKDDKQVGTDGDKAKDKNLESESPKNPDNNGDGKKSDAAEDAEDGIKIEENSLESIQKAKKPNESDKRHPIEPRKFDPVSDDDFKVKEDGSVEIYAQHIKDDIEALRDKPEIVKRILRRDPKKLDVMAQALGIKGDALRSPGRQLADVFDAHQRAIDSGNTEEAEKIKKDFMPDSLFGEGDAKIKFDIKKKPDSTDEGKKKAPKKDEKYKVDFDKISTAVTNYLADKFESDSEKTEWHTKVMRNAKVGSIMAKPRFDQETGKPMELDKHLEYALSVAFPSKGSDIEARPAAPTSAFSIQKGAESKQKVDDYAGKLASKLAPSVQKAISASK